MKFFTHYLIILIFTILAGCSSQIPKSLSEFSEDNHLKISAVESKINKLGAELKLEEAEKFLLELKKLKPNWCLNYYNNGNCKKSTNEIPNSIENALERVRSCVPVMHQCSKQEIDRATARNCIKEINKRKSVSKLP
jgi:hypothetical protein